MKAYAKLHHGFQRLENANLTHVLEDLTGQKVEIIKIKLGGKDQLSF